MYKAYQAKIPKRIRDPDFSFCYNDKRFSDTIVEFLIKGKKHEIYLSSTLLFANFNYFRKMFQTSLGNPPEKINEYYRLVINDDELDPQYAESIFKYLYNIPFELNIQCIENILIMADFMEYLHKESLDELFEILAPKASIQYPSTEEDVPDFPYDAICIARILDIFGYEKSFERYINNIQTYFISIYEHYSSIYEDIDIDKDILDKLRLMNQCLNFNIIFYLFRLLEDFELKNYVRSAIDMNYAIFSILESTALGGKLLSNGIIRPKLGYRDDMFFNIDKYNEIASKIGKDGDFEVVLTEDILEIFSEDIY